MQEIQITKTVLYTYQEIYTIFHRYLFIGKFPDLCSSLKMQLGNKSNHFYLNVFLKEEVERQKCISDPENEPGRIILFGQ